MPTRERKLSEWVEWAYARGVNRVYLYRSTLLLARVPTPERRAPRQDWPPIMPARRGIIVATLACIIALLLLFMTKTAPSMMMLTLHAGSSLAPCNVHASSGSDDNAVGASQQHGSPVVTSSGIEPTGGDGSSENEASALGSVGWAVDGARNKSGAGVLFFAYGGVQLSRFLNEAAAAAQSFRRHNSRLPIAIVTNNESVDARLFTVRVAVRPDLLFAGDTSNGGQNRGDKTPRQWLTRLYYLAHSPFEITWALDSNAVSCTPGAAQAFLDAALATKLWGFDIAHASQAKGQMIYPHNWNIVYRWSAATRSLLRDWLLLQLRRGVTHDDQATLHLAEIRHIAAKRVRVAQLGAAFAAAFVTAYDKDGDLARLTRRIVGRAHVFHHIDHSMCARVNERAESEAEEEVPRQLLARRPKQKAPTEYHAVHSASECEDALNSGRAAAEKRRPCMLHRVEPTAPHGALVLGVTPVFAPSLEKLQEYAASKRCGEDCTAVVDSVVLGVPPVFAAATDIATPTRARLR